MLTKFIITICIALAHAESTEEKKAEEPVKVLGMEVVNGVPEVAIGHAGREWFPVEIDDWEITEVAWTGANALGPIACDAAAQANGHGVMGWACRMLELGCWVGCSPCTAVASAMLGAPEQFSAWVKLEHPKRTASMLARVHVDKLQRTVWKEQGSIKMTPVKRSGVTGKMFREWHHNWTHREGHPDKFCCQAIVKDLYTDLLGWEKHPVEMKSGRNCCMPFSLFKKWGGMTKGLPKNQIMNNEMWNEQSHQWEKMDFALKYKFYNKADYWGWSFMVARKGLQNVWKEDVPKTIPTWAKAIVDATNPQKATPLESLNSMLETPITETVTEETVEEQEESNEESIEEEPVAFEEKTVIPEKKAVAGVKPVTKGPRVLTTLEIILLATLTLGVSLGVIFWKLFQNIDSETSSSDSESASDIESQSISVNNYPSFRV